jgi:poly(3-hydroxybutyrate) depolymerase
MCFNSIFRNIFLVGFIFCSLPVSAEIYKWVDAQGRTHFTDKPPKENKPAVSVASDADKKAEKLAIEQGDITLKSVAHGQYHQYIAQGALDKFTVLVVNHGMFKDKETAVDASYNTLKLWLKFADEHKLILVAPVFDNENYAVTVNGAGNGGYRGLYGRKVGADVFLHEIIDEYKAAQQSYDGRFYLYGHSAGAQFANRYLVRHPHRVIATSFSAPAWFSLPSDKHKWPLGMAKRQYTANWSGESVGQVIDIRPQASTWLEATQISVEVVVGELDLEKMRYVEGIGGDTHVDRAKFWVESMNKFAQHHAKTSRVRLKVVSGVGHNYGKLARVSQQFFAREFAK